MTSMLRERARSAEVLLHYPAGRTLRVDMERVEAELDVRQDDADVYSVTAFGAAERYVSVPQMVTLTLRGTGATTRFQESAPAAVADPPVVPPEPVADVVDDGPLLYSRDFERGRWLL